MPSVAIIAIGNELLSGNIRDKNAQFAIDLLRRNGADLERVVMIPDDVDVIAEEVSACARRFDVVITSGGVGPTHDDVTYEGVARGFGIPLVEDAGIAALLRRHFGERLTDDHLRMARFPEGALVKIDPAIPIPIASVRNVHILPGIPFLFNLALEHLAPSFQGKPFFYEEVVCARDEGEIAAFLRTLQEEFPQVFIGSYPGTAEGERHLVRVTIEGRDSDSVGQVTGKVRSTLL